MSASGTQQVILFHWGGECGKVGGGTWGGGMAGLMAEVQWHSNLTVVQGHQVLPWGRGVPVLGKDLE